MRTCRDVAVTLLVLVRILSLSRSDPSTELSPWLQFIVVREYSRPHEIFSETIVISFNPSPWLSIDYYCC